MAIHLLTSVFASAETFRLGMERLRRSAPNLAELGVTHTLWDQHYPVDRDKVLAELAAYKASAGYPVEIIGAGRDVGLAGAVNGMLEHIKVQPDDIVFGHDPDCEVLTPGWIEAMLRVYAADLACGWLSCAVHLVKKHQIVPSGMRPTDVGGERVYILDNPLQFDAGSLRGRAILDVGRWTETNAYYGGSELAMFPRYKKAGYWIGIMHDYECQGRVEGVDPRYVDWKLHHAGHKQPVFPGSFAEWISRG